MEGAAPAQAPIIVVLPSNTVMKSSDKEHFQKNFPSKVVLGLSITHIVIGALSFVLQVFVLTACRHFGRWGIENVGAGIWVGVFYALSGSFGLLAVKKTSTCTLVNLMVFAILSACLSVPYFTISANCIETRYGSNIGSKAIFSLMVFLSLASGIVAIILAAITCRVTCCRSGKESAGIVAYNPTTQQPIPMSDLPAYPGLPVATPLPDAKKFEGLDKQVPKAEENVYESASDLVKEPEEKGLYQRLYD